MHNENNITPEAGQSAGLSVATGSAFRPGDTVTLNVRHPIWNGIECRLIEKHEDTGQWKMENVHGTKHTVYFYEDDFLANIATQTRPAEPLKP